MKIVSRPGLTRSVQAALRRTPIVALLGPRQCGKTTLARVIAAASPRAAIFDLESERDRARLGQAEALLERQRGLVVLDEIQRQPELLPILRVLADRRPLACRFLILGSASPELTRHSSETLAGRVEFIGMEGLSLEETGQARMRELWLRGGFPRSFLARGLAESFLWRENFIRTFLERDIPQLGIRVPARQLLRFWTMLAHTHGQVWNASQIAGSLGVSHPTTRHYVDILSGAFIARQLQPWFENVGKRVVKAPKVYVRDSGLLHALLSLRDWQDVEGHPKYGLSWEGFALEQLLQRFGDRQAYFWATHAGAELDLLLIRRGKKWGVEFKTADTPVLTKSMSIAVSDLALEHLWVVHPGTRSYSIDKRVDCVGLGEALRLRELRS